MTQMVPVSYVGANYWPRRYTLMAIPRAKLMPLIFSGKYLKFFRLANYAARAVVYRKWSNVSPSHERRQSLLRFAPSIRCRAHYVSIHYSNSTHTPKYRETKVRSRVAELFAPFISLDSPLLLLFIDSLAGAHRLPSIHLSSTSLFPKR